MKKNIFLIFLILLIFIACKKDNPSGANEFIVGRWFLLPSTFELYTNGSLSSTSTQQYSAGDYGEFKSNGTFENLINGTIFHNQYRLAGDTIIFDNTHKGKITILTTDRLSYYFRDSINPTQYRINTFNFKK